ncbi:hypothetical protein FQN54_001860 [Arachnomyces sp. PD_36]|nr:hypothetical protein FQN54_001860 [Arachnomyces sp. PD_36]
MPEEQSTKGCSNGNSTESRVSPAEQPPHRSIGMHTLLNPSHSQSSTQESQNSKKRGYDTPSTSPSQSIAQHDQSASSQPRRIITPISPGTQSLNPQVAAPPGTIHSPFIQSPESQVSASGPSSQEGVEGSRGLFSAAFRKFSQPYAPPQLTPPYDERRPSSGELSDPRSQTGSPSTPHSLYSQFSRASPAPVQGHPQQPMERSNSASNSFVNTWNPSLQQPHPSREPQRNSFPQLAIHNGHDIIPIEIDVESASTRANEKRSNNRDASKRHRDRKKDAEAEKARTLELQEQKIKFLTEERDHYHTELEYFRDIVNRTTGLGRIPPRPLSPRHRRPLALANAETAGGKNSSQTQERGMNSGRNTRRKVKQEPASSLPTPPSTTSLTPLPPLNYTMAPIQHAYPASSWPVGPVRSPNAVEGSHPAQHHMAPYPSPQEVHSQASTDRSWNPAT